MALTSDTKAPDFTLFTAADMGRPKNSLGLTEVSLSDYFGKQKVVLLFLPGAFTPVCTAQLHFMSQDFEAYRKANTVVLGVTCDTPFVQQAWLEKENFQIPMLSDYKREVIKLYDVVQDDILGMGQGSQRAYYTIGKNGIIQYASQTPTILDMPDKAEILRTVQCVA